METSGWASVCRTGPLRQLLAVIFAFLEPVTHNGKPSPVPAYIVAALVDVFQPTPTAGDAGSPASVAWLRSSVLQRELLGCLASWLRQQGTAALEVMQKQLVRVG
jgi:hypothetical protein